MTEVTPQASTITRKIAVALLIALASVTVFTACSSKTDYAASGPCDSSSAKELSEDETNQVNQLLSDGMAKQNAGAYDEAMDSYEKVLAIDCRNKAAYYDMGLLAQVKQNTSDAERYYGYAIQIDPTYSPALYNWAIIKHDAGDVQGAISFYKTAVQADPNFAAAHLNLGFALQEVGQVDEGQASLDTAVQLDPSLASRIPAPVQPTVTPTVTVSPTAVVVP